MQLASKSYLNDEQNLFARDYIDFDPNEIIDEKGRSRRWVFELTKKPDLHKIPFCCAKYHPEVAHENDLYFVESFGLMEQRLFIDLEVRSRAI